MPGENTLYVPGENATAVPILKSSEVRAVVESWAQKNAAAASALVDRIGVMAKEKKSQSEILGTIFETIGSVVGVLK